MASAKNCPHKGPLLYILRKWLVGWYTNMNSINWLNITKYTLCATTKPCYVCTYSVQRTTFMYVGDIYWSFNDEYFIYNFAVYFCKTLLFHNIISTNLRLEHNEVYHFYAWHILASPLSIIYWVSVSVCKYVTVKYHTNIFISGSLLIQRYRCIKIDMYFCSHGDTRC